MQMGSECSSPRVAPFEENREVLLILNYFFNFALSLCVPKQKKLSIALCNFSFTSFPLQVIVYEKPFFEGRHVEVESEILMLDDKESEEKMSLTSVGSMKVLGGV